MDGEPLRNCNIEDRSLSHCALFATIAVSQLIPKQLVSRAELTRDQCIKEHLRVFKLFSLSSGGCPTAGIGLVQFTTSSCLNPHTRSPMRPITLNQSANYDGLGGATLLHVESSSHLRGLGPWIRSCAKEVHSHSLKPTPVN